MPRKRAQLKGKGGCYGLREIRGAGESCFGVMFQVGFCCWEKGCDISHSKVSNYCSMKYQSFEVRIYFKGYYTIIS